MPLEALFSQSDLYLIFVERFELLPLVKQILHQKLVIQIPIQAPGKLPEVIPIQDHTNSRTNQYLHELALQMIRWSSLYISTGWEGIPIVQQVILEFKVCHKLNFILVH